MGEPLSSQGVPFPPGSGRCYAGGMDFRRLIALAALLGTVPLAACGPDPPARSPETLAVEERAGDFLDYYEEVLRLSRRYTAHPDSFQTALNGLPGTHLTDEEWEAWTAPYREDAETVATRLEAVIADLAKPR